MTDAMDVSDDLVITKGGPKVGPKVDKKADIEECLICAAHYTPQKRQKVVCASCGYALCTECLRTLVKNASTDLGCVNCQKPFDRIFLARALAPSFMATSFRDYRMRVLNDQYQATLPEAQGLARVLRCVDDDNKDMRVLDEKVREIKAELYRYETRLHQVKLRILRGENYLNGISERNPYESQAIDLTGDEGGELKFVTRGNCPSADCRGYIGAGWKCEICDTKVCQNCMANLGKPEDGIDPRTHGCKPEDLTSVKMIRETSKPCPNCRARIFKTHGCNQIWCTNCKSAFDYHTLRQLDANRRYFHNPHYSEYLRSRGENPTQGAAVEPVDPCNDNRRLFQFRESLRRWTRAAPERERESYSKLYKKMDLAVLILNGVHLDFPSHDAQERKMKLTQAEFLANKISKDDFERKLQRLEKVYANRLEKAQIGQTFAFAVRDICDQFIGNERCVSNSSDFAWVKENIDKICDFSNTALVNTQKYFGFRSSNHF